MYSLLDPSNIIILDMDETEQLKSFSKRIPKRPAQFTSGWLLVCRSSHDFAK